MATSNTSVSDFSILSGIPFINKDKISISSEEYMTEFTINRGFLNLLQNDIYINQILTYYGDYLQNTVKPHIADSTIHFPWSDVVELLKSVEGITEDTVVRLPINKSVSYIKQKIKDIPRNLNGHTLLFEFCVPQSIVDENNDTSILLRKFIYTTIDNEQQLLNPTLSLLDRGIVFDGFYGGTLIVTGSVVPINDKDPITGNVNADYFNNWITGMSAGTIINNYQYEMIKADHPESLITTSTNQLKSLLTISGTGINVNFAPISFRNCQCDVYLYKLMCHNIINSSTVSINYDDYDLPTYEDVVLFWPMEGTLDSYIVNNEYVSAAALDYNLKVPDDSEGNSLELTVANYKDVETINESKVFKNPDNFIGEPIECYIINEGNIVNKDDILYYYLNNDKTYRNANGFTTAMEFKNFIYNFSDIIYGGVTGSENDDVKRGITLCFWGNKKYNDTVGMPFMCDINDSVGDNKVYGFELGTNGFLSYQNKNAYTENDTTTLYTVVPEGVIGAGNTTLQDTTDQWVMYVVEIEEFYGTINKTNDHITSIKKQSWSENYGQENSIATLMWQISMKIGYYNEDVEQFDFERITSPKMALDGNYNKDTCVIKPEMQPLIDPSTNLPNDNVRMFRFGSNYFDDTIASKHVWRGALRNMIIFNQIYDNERKLVGYMKQGIQSYYDWNNKGDLEIIKSINSNSAIGSLSAFNVKNLDINNCYLKQHVKSVQFIVESDETL